MLEQANSEVRVGQVVVAASHRLLISVESRIDEVPARRRGGTRTLIAGVGVCVLLRSLVAVASQRTV